MHDIRKCIRCIYTLYYNFACMIALGSPKCIQVHKGVFSLSLLKLLSLSDQHDRATVYYNTIINLLLHHWDPSFILKVCLVQHTNDQVTAYMLHWSYQLLGYATIIQPDHQKWLVIGVQVNILLRGLVYALSMYRHNYYLEV